MKRSSETEVVLAFVRGPRVLDVGCGNGRYLELLASAGHRPTGVDANPATVERMRSQGYEVYAPSNLPDPSDEGFDTVLMSHVVEHMTPDQMLETIDLYLGYLAPGGALVVASPLMYPGFYDDYDHVKPYTPQALARLFGDETQVQRKPRHRLALQKVWLRKTPRHRRLYPGAHSALAAFARRSLNRAAYLLFAASGGRMGATTGWVGLFTKTPPDGE